MVSGGPAEKAGLAAGDVIVSVDGHSIDSPNALTTQLLGHHPGDTVTIGYQDQSGNQQTAQVTLGDGPAQ